MRLLAPYAVWLVYCSLAAAQDAPKAQVRFFNDSAKAVGFYVDGQFGCSIPANPDGNNAYCDAEAAIGKHKISVKEARLPIQSCDLYLGRAGAEANLSKAERLNCFTIAAGQ
ncbi:MAG: hypothetical protein WAK26_02755 [Terracidiphilus sp.]